MFAWGGRALAGRGEALAREPLAPTRAPGP
jgi:hypothetical protein